MEGNSVVNAFDLTQNRHEISKFGISTKYSGISDLISNKQISIEGSVSINDPAKFNISSSRLTDTKSPGIYVSGVRAFSSSNNPWTKVGTALSTSSQEVSVAELNFANEIVISGISTVLDTNVSVNDFTHTIPVSINGETYYLLLLT